MTDPQDSPRTYTRQEQQYIRTDYAAFKSCSMKLLRAEVSRKHPDMDTLAMKAAALVEQIMLDRWGSDWRTVCPARPKRAPSVTWEDLLRLEPSQGGQAPPTTPSHKEPPHAVHPQRPDPRHAQARLHPERA